MLSSSLSEGRLPISCKRAVLTPLPKKGDLREVVFVMHQLQNPVENFGQQTEGGIEAGHPYRSSLLCTQQIDS